MTKPAGGMKEEVIAADNSAGVKKNNKSPSKMSGSGMETGQEKK